MKQEKITKLYPVLTGELKTSNSHDYHLGIILVLVEAYKDSYKCVDIKEVSSNGTSIDFILIADESEKENYKKSILNLIEDFKTKYSGLDLSNILD